MKKIIYGIMVMLLAVSGFAQTKTHNFELDYEFANYKYTEPGLMNLKAQQKHGISAAYSYVGDASETGRSLFFSLGLRYLQGDVDYNGGLWDGTPYKAENLRDYYFEAALHTGRKYVMGERTSLIPYAGLGWRQLRNHLEDSGEGGYLRQSTYVYIPMGIHVLYAVPGQWSARLNGELDFLLIGQQISDFEDSLGKITNDQNNGYGLRLSLRLEKNLGSVGIFVEPFWRYWEIDNSDTTNVFIPGEGWAGLQEPKNRTREYGIKAGISF